MKLDWVRNEFTRMRGQIRTQEREIRMLQRAGASTASAELLLSRMRAKFDYLCRERNALRKAADSVGGFDASQLREGDCRQFAPATGGRALLQTQKSDNRHALSSRRVARRRRRRKKRVRLRLAKESFILTARRAKPSRSVSLPSS